jgi:6-phosphogluconolactonase (cycloisomerase 2 family)
MTTKFNNKKDNQREKFKMKRTLLNITVTIPILLTLFSLSTLAQGKFVYTNNDRISNNSISGFKVKGDGTLELLPGFPTGTDGGGGDPDVRPSNDKIAITERGPFLFASSDGDQEIASYHLNPNTGALTFIGTINLGDDGPDEVLTMAVAPNEQFLYVANNNTHKVHALQINNDGTLTELEAEQLPDNFRALEIAISPNSKVLALSIFQNEIDADGKLVIFNIADNGFLSEAPGSPFNGSGNGRVGDVVFNCESNLLYVCKEFVGDKGVIDVFHVAQNGAISQIQGSPFVFPLFGSAGTMAISPNGKYLFVGYASFNPPVIGVFKILAGGQPEVVVFSPFPVGYADAFPNGPTDIAVDAKGEHLFVTYKNQHVEALTIGTDGRVTPIKNSVSATGEDSGDNTSSLDSLVAYPLVKKCQIITPDDITTGSAGGACGANVNYPAATTCGVDCGTVTCNPTTGTFFAVGVHTVTCSANGADDATFKITVKDLTPPNIFQQPNINVSTDLNKCSAVVNFVATASDNCTSAAVEADYVSGATFPKGMTTVHITATDKAGNQSNYAFTITVSDTQAPTINCQADLMVNNELNKCGGVANYNLPTVSDNCPGVGVPICNPPAGAFFPIGQTVVTCSVKDAADNSSQCNFKVTVKDTQAPTISCPADKIAVTATPCDAGIVVNYPAPMVGDNCPENLIVVCTPTSGSVFPVGTTNVNCTVTDGGGNQAQCSFKVTIFNVWLQDEGSPTTVLLFNSLSGAYRLCYAGVNQPITGTGTVIKKACTATLEHNAADRKLTAKVDGGTNMGTASFQNLPNNVKVTIIDKNVLNNSNLCP